MDNLEALQREVLARRDEYRDIETELTNHYAPAKILTDKDRENLLKRLRVLYDEVLSLFQKIVRKEAEMRSHR
jgi:hypothetical protein